MLMLSGEKMEHAEKYFADHGKVSTLVGRLVPAVRQLISIPAGLSKMNIGSFTLFTVLGAGIWNSVLALLGYLAYKAADPTIIARYSKQISMGILVVVGILVVFFIVRAIVKKRRKRG